MKIIIFLSSLIMLIFHSIYSQTNLKVGDIAPDFTLEDSDGNTHSLKQYLGKKTIVLYFYPKASTPGCTKQACNIRDNFELLEQHNIVIFGLSVDDKKSLKKFKENEKLNFTLLSDDKKTVSKSYGTINAFGFSKRITFIINKEGKIISIIDNVDVNNHVSQILQEIERSSL